MSISAVQFRDDTISSALSGQDDGLQRMFDRMKLENELYDICTKMRDEVRKEEDALRRAKTANTREEAAAARMEAKCHRAHADYLLKLFLGN